MAVDFYGEGPFGAVFHELLADSDEHLPGVIELENGRVILTSQEVAVPEVAWGGQVDRGGHDRYVWVAPEHVLAEDEVWQWRRETCGALDGDLELNSGYDRYSSCYRLKWKGP